VAVDACRKVVSVIFGVAFVAVLLTLFWVWLPALVGTVGTAVVAALAMFGACGLGLWMDRS